MQRKPRAPTAALFSPALLTRSIALGALMLVFVAAVYAIGLATMVESQARALAFSALIFANLMLIFVSRAPSERLLLVLRQPNPVFWWIAALSVALLALVTYAPPIAAAFRLAAAPTVALVAVAAAGCACALLARLATRRARLTD